MKLTYTQMGNLVLIHSLLSDGVRVTSYYGVYRLAETGAHTFEIGRGAMAQLYRKGAIADNATTEGGVYLTDAGAAAVEAHNRRGITA